MDRARSLWKRKREAKKSFDEIRATLWRMSYGRHRCMYCEDSKGTDIDHFYPLSRYPERAYEWENYLLACSHCNSNEKRDLFPLDPDSQPQLIDPCREDPRKHLTLSFSTGKLTHEDDKGRESIRVFGLNRSELEQGRRDIVDTIQVCIQVYARAKQNGRASGAHRIVKLVSRLSFSSVLVELLHVAKLPTARVVLDTETLSALDQHPEIFDWVSLSADEG